MHLFFAHSQLCLIKLCLIAFLYWLVDIVSYSIFSTECKHTCNDTNHTEQSNEKDAWIDLCSLRDTRERWARTHGLLMRRRLPSISIQRERLGRGGIHLTVLCIGHSRVCSARSLTRVLRRPLNHAEEQTESNILLLDSSHFVVCIPFPLTFP